jgi:uncharacterized RDD family membrane protein YckC
MKCPKCHYLSFEPEPRCKNCGYDLSLSEIDLAIRPAEPEGPLSDFKLNEPRGKPRRPAMVTLGPIHPVADAEVEGRAEARGAAASSVGAAQAGRAEHPETTVVKGAPQIEPVRRAPRSPAPAATAELPLFVKGVLPPERPVAEPKGDAELVRAPSAPRPPLAVRRSGPEASKPKVRPERPGQPPRKLGPFDRDLLEDLKRIEAQTALRRAVPADAAADVAPALRRLGAACLDALLLGAIGGVVFWLTLRQLDVAAGQMDVRPMLPLLAFLLLVAAGYLLLFTVAGGQTVGKMALGLRVVGVASDDTGASRLTIRQAAVRALVMLPSVLVIGIGFLPALVGDGRAFHDRFARTRVVKA